MTTENPDNYIRHVSGYTRFANNSFSWRFIEKPALDRNIPPEIYQSDSTIVDLGSGVGRIVGYHIQRGAGPEKIMGIDDSKSMVAVARQRYPAVHFLHASMQEFVLPDTSIDLITACVSLRYLCNEDLLGLFIRIRQMLRPDGCFLFLDGHPIRYGLADGFDQYFKEEKRSILTPWGEPDFYYYRSLQTYFNLAIKAGLKIQSFDECPVSPEGVKNDPEEYKGYTTPSRFAILSTR